MRERDETHVVTCFLRHRGEVLLLLRSEAVGSYPGRWGGVAGHAEGDPDAAARQEIAEETGLADAVALVRRGEPFAVEDAALEKRWVVHPYLFDCARRDVALDRESTEVAWVPPPEILHRPTVPDLWTSYARVAPTLESVQKDTEHGSAYLSYRALEVLRDRAAVLAHEQQETTTAWSTLCDLARALREVRPSMTALRNRLNRVMHEAAPAPSAERVAQRAQRVLTGAFEAEADAARQAAALLAGRHVLTLSRSGTVMEALLRADPPAASVVVAESRPGSEGRGVAEELAARGLSVTLISDAALACALSEEAVDLVMVGADTISPRGDVVNKTGTRLAALAARHARLPCYAAATCDKISTGGTPTLEQGPAAAVYDGDAALRVLNPLFEVTPGALFSGIVTEHGLLDLARVAQQSRALRALETW